MPTETVIAAIGSLTVAIKARGVLAAAGILSEAVALPPGATKRGCAWGIEFEEHSLPEVRTALRHARISVSQFLKKSTLP